MKTIILIAVRLKSSRLPKKAISKIEDQTLIEHLIDRMKSVKNIFKVIVCTSTNPQDDVLEDISRKKGIECFRGSENNVIERFYLASKKYNPDLIIRTTGDNCLVSTEFIEEAITKHIENKADYTTTEKLPRGGKAEVISFSTLIKLLEYSEDPNSSEYMTWFLDNPDIFRVQKLNVKPEWDRPNYRITCDTPNDLKLIKEIYSRLYKQGNIVDFSSVIKLLDNNPDLVALNKEVKQVSKDDVGDIINYKVKKQ